MKKIIAAAFVASALSLSNVDVMAQEVKLGYTSELQILPLMPEFKQKQSELESYSKVLENQLKIKQDEFQAKYAKYEKEANDLPPVVRQEKEKELRNLQQSAVEFQETAQKDLQEKEKALLEPLYDKIQKAIDEVAKENNFSMVFNAYDGTGRSNLLYAAANTDITPLVLKKLGIEPPKEGTTTTGGK